MRKLPTIATVVLDPSLSRLFLSEFEKKPNPPRDFVFFFQIHILCGCQKQNPIRDFGFDSFANSQPALPLADQRTTHRVCSKTPFYELLRFGER